MKTFFLSTQFGWIVNGLAWVVFILTGNHMLEIILGILCGYVVYIGYKNSEKKLIGVSLFNTVWMLLWGFGIMGDTLGGLDILNLVN